MSAFPCSPPRSFVQLILILISISRYTVIFVHGQTRVISTDVDDTDAGINYSSGWLPVTENKAFDKTEHLSRQQGATANFTFVGIGIQVFGIVLSASFGGNTTSTYFLDEDQDGQSFTAPGNLTVAELDVMFYQSPSNLSNGTHTLRIVNDNNDAWYIIDFFTVLSLSASSNGSTISSTLDPASSSTSSPTAVSTRSSPSPTMESTNNTISAPVSFFTRKPAVSPGAAAGIALSSAIILGVFVAILLFICHRRRRRNTELAKLTAIDPFVEGFLRATNNDNNNNNQDDRKREFSPSGSPAAVETSAHGMFYPYMVEFFSRSRGPRSFKSLISPSRRSTRSAKLNVSPMSVPPVPIIPTLPTTNVNAERPRQLPPQPQPRPPPPPRPPPVITFRRSTRRNTKFSFLSNLSGGKGRENDISPTSPATTTDVQMGIAI